MRKIIIRLHLPEPKVRKLAVKAVQKHRDKTKYTRKCKHKATGFGGLRFSASGMAQELLMPLLAIPASRASLLIA